MSRTGLVQLSEQIRLAVIGAGGAGGYFGGRWAEAGHDVTLVARGAHFESIRRHGLQIHSPVGDATVPVKVVDDPGEIGPVDLVVFATKSWQLEDAIVAAAPGIDATTTLFFGLQNGVDTADLLRRYVAAPNVLGATCRIVSLVEAPGVIRHVGVEPTLIFGELDGGRSDRTTRLEAGLNLGPPLSARASEEVVLEIWRKFLFFAPVSGVGSVTGAPFGGFRAVPEARALLDAAVREVYEVAEASGIALGDDAVANTLAFIDSLPPEGTSSMQRDFAAGRRTELDILSGAVSRIGRTLGVLTLAHDHIYASLLPRELKARGELAW